MKKHFVYLRQAGKRTVTSFTVLLLLLSACKDDPRPSDNCRIQMTYDAEITTLIRPDKIADTARLSDLDRALTLPKREREKVQLCIDAQGNYTITTQYDTPERPITYPPHTAGVWPKPRYHRAVNVNGQITYYNAQNEVIDVDFSGEEPSGSALEILHLLRQLKNAPSITDQQFAAALDTLAARGLPLTHHDPNFATGRIYHADGSSSVFVIDKKARMQVGQFDYDADDKLSSFYLLRVEGVAPNVTFKRLHSALFFNAIDSNVRMKHETITEFKTFSLTF
jgi:hypothetical protein